MTASDPRDSTRDRVDTTSLAFPSKRQDWLVDWGITPTKFAQIEAKFQGHRVNIDTTDLTQKCTAASNNRRCLAKALKREEIQAFAHDLAHIFEFQAPYDPNICWGGAEGYIKVKFKVDPCSTCDKDGHNVNLGVGKFLVIGTGVVTAHENILRLVEGYGAAIPLCSQQNCHRPNHQLWADVNEERYEHRNANRIRQCRHDPRYIVSSAQSLQIWKRDSNFLPHLERFPDSLTTKPK
jgi:hypothetical protein